MRPHPTLTEDEIAALAGQEMQQVAKAANNGGRCASAHIVAWAKANPDSAWHWMMDWSPGVTDEQRIAHLDKVAAGTTGPIKL